MDFEQIGMRIKACRKQKHLTQEKLAECLDVSSHYIYELERGVKTMSLYTLNDLSTCLEVSSDYLLYGKDNTDSNPIPEDALSVMIKDLPSQQRNRLADLLKVMMPYISLDESSQTSGNDAGRKKSKYVSTKLRGSHKAASDFCIFISYFYLTLNALMPGYTALAPSCSSIRRS